MWVQNSVLVHPSLLDDPEGLASVVDSAKYGAVAHGERVDGYVWQKPEFTVVSVPRNQLDGDTPDVVAPVEMLRVQVAGRRSQS